MFPHKHNLTSFVVSFLAGALVGFVIIVLASCGTQLNESETVDVRGGEDGANCYDGTGDTNGDGVLSSADCVGVAGAAGQPGSQGTSCFVTQVADGAIITCGESTAKIANGAQGATGSKGDKGEQGESGTPGADGKVETETLIYRGYACSRTVVSLGDTWFLVNNQLQDITDTWVKVSNCEVRYSSKKAKLEFK